MSEGYKKKPKMNLRVAKGIYLSIENYRQVPILRILQELEQSQWYSSSRLQELQWLKLQRLIRHCYENLSFYRDKFKELGMRPEDIKTPGDFKSIPTLTKEEFRNNIERLKASNINLKLIKAKTSGSTGLPMMFYKDGVALANHRAAMYRGHRWFNVNIGAKEAKLCGIPGNFKQRVYSRLSDFFLNRFRQSKEDLSEEVLYGFYRKLMKERPDYLCGYSSMIYELASFIKQNDLSCEKLNLKMVKCTSETILQFHRDLIEEVFNCKVVSEYGAAEVGVIAFECPEGRHHIMSDSVYLEFSDEKIESIGNQDLRELIVTDLNNYAFPILRYRIGDMGMPSAERSCPCGRNLPLLKGVLGRSHSVVRGANGKKFHSSIFHYIVKSLVARSGGIRQFKVYQKSEREISYEIVKDDCFDERSEAYLRKRTLKLLGDNMKVVFKYVDRIPRDKSGKLRYFVSEINS